MLLVLLIAGLLILIGAALLTVGRRAARQAPPAVQIERAQSHAAPIQRSRRSASLNGDHTRPGPRTTQPAVNPAALNRLRLADAGEGAAVLAALIDAFLDGGPAQLDSVDASLRDGDRLGALGSLSLFRTSARLLGAAPLDGGAQRLQDAIDRGDTGTAQATLDTLRAEFWRAAAELQRLQSIPA